MTTEQQKFYDIKHYSKYKTVGNAVDYAVIVDDEKKEVVLQWEESRQKSDWINNFLFFPWPLRLGDKTVWTTYGYAKAYKSCKDEPMLAFCMAYVDNPDYKLAIRGWSYGSAMAKISARHFVIKAGFRKDYILDELTTFADIKCWLNPFTRYSRQIKVVHEYSNPNDLLSLLCVPFYSRTHRSRVGKFSLLKAIHPEYHHTHYEDYDYSKYEE